MILDKWVISVSCLAHKKVALEIEKPLEKRQRLIPGSRGFCFCFLSNIAK